MSLLYGTHGTMHTRKNPSQLEELLLLINQVLVGKFLLYRQE